MMDKKLATIYDELSSSNVRLTKQRRAVINRLLTIRKHLSADEIADLLKKDRINVSRATVYRLLSILRKNKLIESHDFDMRKRLYEAKFGRIHHDHLCCIDCDRIEEFHDDVIEELQWKITKKYGFKEIYHSFKIFGYCRLCGTKK